MNDTIQHAHFCTPRPELPEARLEAFTRTTDDGRTAHIQRCIDCGEQTVTFLGRLTG